MKTSKRMLLAAAMSWGYAVTLGLLWAACSSGSFNPITLFLPGVALVALIVSTVISIIITPVAMWSVRTGGKNLRIYGPILWIVLAIYIVFLMPRVIENDGRIGLYVLLILAAVGSTILGFIPAAK